MQNSDIPLASLLEALRGPFDPLAALRSPYGPQQSLAALLAAPDPQIKSLAAMALPGTLELLSQKALSDSGMQSQGPLGQGLSLAPSSGPSDR